MDRYHLTLELDYKDIPIPRENDATITSIAIGHGFGGDDLLGITRCRLSCCSIFLSDITAANGRYLDPTRGHSGFDYRPFTRYAFPCEQPSDHDWMVWDRLWTQHCYADGSLPRTLGKWLHNTHRLWEWFYHPTEDVIVQRVGKDWWAYRSCLDADAVLGSSRYARVGEWASQSLQGFLPTTIRVDGSEIVHLLVGPPLKQQVHCT